jgi:hypothetical protein
MVPPPDYPKCPGCESPVVRPRYWCSEACRERHRPRRPGDRHKTIRTPTKRYAGVDGESIDGRYTLLAWASDDGDDAWIENTGGLTTRECLDFLCETPKGLHCWGFAFGYDVNMMLADVPVWLVTRLYETGQCYWREFRIAYTPGKKLTVSKYKRSGTGNALVGSCTVWDMFTWIQTSFVNWLEAWTLASPEDIARIRAMKLQRATFATADARAIRRYCLSECRYLAAGARRLVDLIASAGVNVTTFYSPATISKALLKREHVTDFRADVPREIEAHVEAAYMGGRAEVSQIGPIDGPVFQYDIRSAYPAMAVTLPCLAHGEWVGPVLTKWPIVPWSLCKVSWRPKRGNPHPTWGPLPVRPKTGSLRWPSHGTGWFWGVEVLAARRHAKIELKEHWRFVSGCNDKPFAYLHDLYQERRDRKDRGDPAEFVLKLALNATYGALAEHPHRAQKDPPKFRCLAWAGWITAATRAALLDVLSDDVVLMATDSLVSRGTLDVPLGSRLGEWECKQYDRMFIAGTGIYWGFSEGSWQVTKTRGFEPGQLTREAMEALWDTDGRVGQVRMTRRRFIGMGTALHRIHGFYPPYARLWRQFIDEHVDKSLDLTPRRAWISDDIHDGRTVAPTLKSSKQEEREDLARLQALNDRWDELWARYARDVEDPRIFAQVAADVELEEMVRVASMIATIERGHNRFRDEIDPAL